jgi:hypothetical protein
MLRVAAQDEGSAMPAQPRSYIVARDSVAAANAELDEFAAQFDL